MSESEAKTSYAGGFTATTTTGTGYVDPRGVYGSGGVVSSGTTGLSVPGSWVRVGKVEMPSQEFVTFTSGELYRAMYKEIELSVRKGEAMEEQGRIYASYFMRIHAAILAEQALAAVNKEAADLTNKAESELEALKYKEAVDIKTAALAASLEELKLKMASSAIARTGFIPTEMEKLKDLYAKKIK